MYQNNYHDSFDSANWRKRKWGNAGRKQRSVKPKIKRMRTTKVTSKEESNTDESKLDSWGNRKWGVKEEKKVV